MVVADVHLGLGATPERPEGPPEASSGRMADELLRLVRTTQSDAVLVDGDLKHPIVGTPPALRPVVFDFFARLLAEDLPVELVLGNHDGGLVPYVPREVVVHSPAGVAHDGVGFFHGHRWPSANVLGSSRLVAGHLHPGYRLAAAPDDPEGKRRCWVRVEREPGPRTASRGRGADRIRAREVVVLPAFNPIAGVEALNRERPARGRSFLYRRFLAGGRTRAYLLDGTDLGELPSPPGSDPRTSGAGRPPKGR